MFLMHVSLVIRRRSRCNMLVANFPATVYCFDPSDHTNNVYSMMTILYILLIAASNIG